MLQAITFVRDKSMESGVKKAQRFVIVGVVFLVVLAIFPFTPSPAADIKILVYELGACAVLLLGLFAPGNTLEVLRRNAGFSCFIFGFLALYAAATLQSPNIGYSFVKEVLRMTALVVLFAATANAFRTTDQRCKLIGAYCIAVAISSVYGVAQAMGIDPFPWDTANPLLRESPSTYGNPNFASHALAPAIILAAGLGARRKSRWALLCLPFYFAHFALTQTRGSLVAVVSAALLVIVAVVISRKVKTPARAIATTFATCFVIGVVGIATLSTILYWNTGRAYPEDSSSMLRYHSFYGACRMIQDAPILGYGPGMYQSLSPEYWTVLEQERFGTKKKLSAHVHDEPLEIAVDAGIPAAVAYMAILILGTCIGLMNFFASETSERRRVGLMIAAFYIAYFVDGLVGFNAHVPVSTLILFLIAGVTAGLRPEVDEESSPSTVSTRRLRWAAGTANIALALMIATFAIRHFAAEIYQELGRVAMEDSAYAESGRLLAKATTLAPYNAFHWFMLSGLEIEEGRYRDGFDHAARSLELNPHLVTGHLRLAKAAFNVALTSQGPEAQAALDETVASVQRAVELSYSFPGAHEMLGKASILQANWLAGAGSGNSVEAKMAWLDAEQHLLRAIEYNSKSEAELYRLIAEVRLAAPDVPGAQEALMHAIELKPDDKEAWKLFLGSCRESNQFEPIRTSLEWRIGRLVESRETVGELGTLWLTLAQVLYEGYGDETGAENAYARLVGRYPDRAEVWSDYYAFAHATNREASFNTSLTNALAAQDLTAEHLPPAVKAVGLGREHSDEAAANGVAFLLDAVRRSQAEHAGAAELATDYWWAAHELANAANIAPPTPRRAGEVFLGLGLVFDACQDAASAVEMYAQAMPHLQANEERLYCAMQMGSALTRSGRTKDAADVFEQAIAIAPKDVSVRLAYARALASDGRRAQARLEYDTILTRFALGEAERKVILAELAALSG